MDITLEQKKIIQDIFKKILPINTKVFIFGSRATKAKKKFSDLDLAIDANTILSISILSDLEHYLSESDLPYKVDIVDLNNINENFRKKIQAEMISFFDSENK